MLHRAAFILARLAQVEINDNWTNKPANSLEAIFRAWMPQTAASHEERVALMKALAKRFPDVAWKICVAQFSSLGNGGHYSHKPRWRPDGQGFGEPFETWEPVTEFIREMIEMALSWKEHTLGSLSDLVERLPSLQKDEQTRVWELIEAWAKEKASDTEKAMIREKIRVSLLSRLATIRARKSAGEAALTGKAKDIYAALEPSDVLNKHAWLFRDNWVDEPADEIQEIEKIDYQKRHELIERKRIAAMDEILDQRGLAGLLALAQSGKTAGLIGQLAVKNLLAEVDIQEFLRRSFQLVREDKDGAVPFKNLIVGAFHSISNPEEFKRVVKAVSADISEKDMARLLVLAPFDNNTWNLVDMLTETAQDEYWTNAMPGWLNPHDMGDNEGIERLLKAERPRTAFFYCHLCLEKIDTLVLYRLLSEMAKGGRDRQGEYLIESYDVEKAFKNINKCPTLTIDQKAGLELLYIDVLEKRSHGYGIPNLERYIEDNPELFAQAVIWVLKREDNGADPAELQVPPDQRETIVERGVKLMRAIKRIPGHDDHGELNAVRLANWITMVRQSCAELSRAEIADFRIGKLLAHAPVGNDGVWPCEPVRQVMEEIASELMMRGAHEGVYNARGVHWRREGGDQERELADKYRAWAQALRFSHPFVSSNLLMKLVKTYEHEANREDLEAEKRRRLP
jgi:hypothetical protein